MKADGRCELILFILATVGFPGMMKIGYSESKIDILFRIGYII